jgi:hypothetical protein
MYLLFLLLLMATPNIELQTVQQPLVQDAKVFDRNSI